MGDDSMIEALRHERERHDLAGRVEEVARVDRELAGYGYTAPTVDPPVETTADSTPLERAVPPGVG